ncbi:MAG: aspartyl-tRNA amidotransferase subunit B [Bryobacteraceae bacterium]|nr:MAG: aspartyl-tRNA amidotransferase subunit B [Bryobacteraceae bacterium]
MALLDQLQKDMAAAMKSRDEARLATLRMMKSALMKEKVDSMKELDEAAELKVLNSLIKQRKDAAEMYRQGGRPELAEKEEAEMKLIESYMPAAATEEEMAAAVEAAVAETGATSSRQMGQVIAAARAKLAGKRIDGKRLSDLVKARLG